jgi:cytoskeletal protein RodZ
MAPVLPARVLPIFALLVVAAVSSCGTEDSSAPSSAGETRSPSVTPSTRTPSPTPTALPSTTQAPTTAAPKPKLTDPAAACATRKGNAGEIYVWNSYGSDQPPDAMRLGAGYVWNFGDATCITSTEFALTTNPGLPGFCTKVAKVSTNPGYQVDDIPAPRLKDVIGQSGDC